MADGGAEENQSIRRNKDKSIIPAERRKAFYEVANETRADVNSVEAEDDSPPDEGMTLTFPLNEDGGYGQLQLVNLFTADPVYSIVDELGVGCSNTDNVADEAFLQVVGENSLTNNREQLQLLLQQNPVEVTASGNTNSGSLECPASSPTTNSSTSSEAEDSMSKPGVLTEMSDVMDVSTKAQEVFKTAGNLPKDWMSSKKDKEKGKYGLQAYLEGVKQFKDGMTRKSLSNMSSCTKEQFSWTVRKSLAESLTVFYRHTERREMEGNMLKYCMFYEQTLTQQVQRYKLQVIVSLGAKE